MVAKATLQRPCETFGIGLAGRQPQDKPPPAGYNRCTTSGAGFFNRPGAGFFARRSHIHHILSFVAERNVDDLGKDKYKRTLGVVGLGERNINLEMARGGWT